MHMNVQFSGFLPNLEEHPKPTILFSLFHTSIQLWGPLNNSRGTEAPCALSIGVVILHLRNFSNVWSVVVVSPVFSLTEIKTLLFEVLLAFWVLLGLLTVY